MKSRIWWGIAAVLGCEVFLFVRYAEFGALFHYFVHGFTGAGLAVAVLTLVRLARPRGRAADLWAVGFAGHLVAAAPDVLFLLIDLPHQPWMDAFVAHVAVHFVPSPLALTFGLFAAGLLGVVAHAYRQRGLATLIACSVLLGFAGGLAVREPIPGTIEHIRAAPEIALRCDLDV